MRTTVRWGLPLSLVMAVAFAAEPVDLEVVHHIRHEAFENSKVMDYMFWLTDVHGPRLTNSPKFHAASDWAIGAMKEAGLANPRKEKWGPFGRGWSHERFSAELLEPGYTPLVGFPMAWSAGTGGPVTAEPVLAPMKEEKDFEKHKGKLRDKIVLIDETRDTPMLTTPPGRRWTEKELEDYFLLPLPTGKRPTPPDREKRRRFVRARNQFLLDEGALAALSTGYRGDGGTVFATSFGSYEKDQPVPPPAAAITPEHYNRIVRLLEKKVPVKIRLDIAAKIHDETLDSHNIVAEIPGARRKDEIVLIGAHFDSWHGGTGATDNASGSAVMMEVMRILKAAAKPMDRTVRIVLWSGEEQGLLGSKAYVKEHFADPETMKPTSAHARVAAYFNYDNGTGRVRGVWLQGNDMVRPIFQAWMEPLKDLGVNTLSIRNTSGTDHLSFDAVGLPGFQFIQDPVEYSTRTHHSNMDVYDHIQPGDLMQAAAVIATFTWHAATRAERLPRKPLPKPKPKEEVKEPQPTGR